MCAAEMIEHRKNSWELYGFDFMVDDEYNAWLIEINSSPACDYSTPVTERYVQKALVELLSVVLDVREWETQPKKTRGPCPETGGWEKIYQGPLLDMPVGAFGTEMSLKGEAYKNVQSRAAAANAHTVNVSYQHPQAESSGNKGGAPSASGSAKVARTGSSAVPDSPKRIMRTHTISTAASALPSESMLAVEKKAQSTMDETDGPALEEISQDFDDSDEEEIGIASKNAERPKERQVMASQMAAVNLGADIGAGGPSISSKQSNKTEIPTKGKQQNISGPMVASIPIKVFSVEF